MSDEVLIINTGQELPKPKPLEPLPLYDENYYMLQQTMPEYKEALPNAYMNNLVTRLQMTMKKFSGIGLSANQCGVMARVFIIGHEDFSIVCINPRVIGQSVEMIKTEEGCLSFPGLFCKIDRPVWVDVAFVNEKGQPIQTRLEGVTARCFLHELDHMNGVKFVKHVGPVALKMARERQNKRIKLTKRRMKNNELLV